MLTVLQGRNFAYRVGDEIRFELTQGKTCRIDVESWPIVRGYRWYANKDRKTFYVATSIKREDGARSSLQLHRLLKNAPRGVRVDHRNHDGCDNRMANLRLVTNGQNMRNRSEATVGGTSSLKGVCWARLQGKWNASVKLNEVAHYIGQYTCPYRAAIARDVIAYHLDAEHFSLNFPDVPQLADKILPGNPKLARRLAIIKKRIAAK